MESGFFPLDEELDLEEGWLSPRSQEHLVHLAIWMPFERATEMLAELTGVQTSEATARRRSYRVGEAALEVEVARASDPVSEVPEEIRKAKHIVSTDGAMVPLIHGQWAEVKTVAVARVEEGKESEEVHSTDISYFSRMLDAASFAEHASAELLRRGIDLVEQWSAVMDGAEWIDGFVDMVCPAVLFRILDFPHAGEYINEIGKLTQAEGSVLPEGWLSSHLHNLKHDGPATVLAELRALRDRHAHVEEIGKKLAYLEKRETRMHYPLYQAQGWPIGSGIVESGNKVVMQARMKGPGMHWAPEHVNPLLALRCGACSNRWDETYKQAHTHHQKQRVVKRNERRLQRYQQNLQALQVLLFMCKWRSSKSEPPAATGPSLASMATSTLSSSPHSVPPLPPAENADDLISLDLPTIPASPPNDCSKTSRPSPTHPWRRRLLAKK